MNSSFLAALLLCLVTVCSVQHEAHAVMAASPATIRTASPGKVSVNVADLLSRQQSSPSQSVARIVVGRYERAMGDAPPSQGAALWQPSSPVNVKVGGQDIDTASLTLSPPAANPDSIRKLRRILGPDFEKDWMSVEQPLTLQPPTGYPKLDRGLISALETLNFSMDAHSTEQLKQWLLNRASCPIEFVWENLGPTFWPQFIRHGHCKSGHSCSWPAGMSCRQSGSRKLKMLRWVCEEESVAELPARRRYRRQAVADPAAGNAVTLPRHIRRRRRTGYDPERRLRVVSMLIRQLSLQKDGYVCQWMPHEQIVSDQCTCSCA